MQPLDKELRNKLEHAVEEAREIAEAAARAALEHLGVAESKPYVHLTEKERELRRKLRIHGRQLGDRRNSKKETQEIDRLIEEVAYEHWHRMLFARFLAENDLLMYPDPEHPVAVTLQECEDLATDEGAGNGWELASKFAARMLPQIFRPDSPVFELILPPERQQALERLLDDLPQEVFTASDSLGWVYQFWQAKRKDEVNASEVKIGARELPAVTQLFTEPYMVSFLLDNSLGAWWAARRLAEDDLTSAESEEELREKASLPGVPLEYLRFVKDEDGKWIPAAGTFDGWPEHLGELRTLDPCCGSGHFLVSALLMLVPMRMELEGLSAQEAVDAVIRENIHGLEIDQRCVEIAAFNLALAAWRFPGAGGYRTMPKLNLACSGLSVSVAKEEWKSLALGKHNLRIALDWLHEEFKDATVLGSLIDPTRSDATKLVAWDDLEPMLVEALLREQTAEQHEMSVVAHGLAEAARLLGRKYHLVITNVPFLTQLKFSELLNDFASRRFPDSKANLATAFIDRINDMAIDSACLSFVAPQSWWFLKRYENIRHRLLVSTEWKLLIRLGEKAFDSPQAGGELVGLNIILKRAPSDESECSTIDLSQYGSSSKKAVKIISSDLIKVSQINQLRSEDAVVKFIEASTGIPLSSYTTALRGCGTGDSVHFIRNTWEIPEITWAWEFHQTTSRITQHFAGMSEIIRWEEEKGELAALASFVRDRNHAAQNWRRGKPNWRKMGVVVSQMIPFPSTLYTGKIYDPNCCAIVPEDPSLVGLLWCFCSSDAFMRAVREINQNRKVEVKTFLSVKLDVQLYQESYERQYPNGLPEPYSDDPTQWIFHGHPCGSVVWDEEKKWPAHGTLRADSKVLQVAVARLLGYRWPAELDEEMELSDEAREWVGRCESLLDYADTDGIVCIPPVRGEASADDRLLDLLVAAYGNQWSAGKLGELLKQANHAGKILETWLRVKFFAQHCKLFHERPFIWHIWDGLRDGFAVLVNYHKLDRKNLERLIYTYLGDWIKRQKDDIKSGIDGAEERLAAAENLKKILELILRGESPYDIFVRWKPLEEQPIGWDPDLNDGVRFNIRPFMEVPDVRKKGAGVLRDRPNIKWNKDRGKDVESAPWYHLFEGDRINDYHLTLEEKHTARSKKKAK